MPRRFRFFFFNDTATTEIYTLSLHDALPISLGSGTDQWRFYEEKRAGNIGEREWCEVEDGIARSPGHCMTMGTASTMTADRKSTRLNSSHANISYAVFCLKKKIRSEHL